MLRMHVQMMSSACMGVTGRMDAVCCMLDIGHGCRPHAPIPGWGSIVHACIGYMESPDVCAWEDMLGKLAALAVSLTAVSDAFEPAQSTPLASACRLGKVAAARALLRLLPSHSEILRSLALVGSIALAECA